MLLLVVTKIIVVFSILFQDNDSLICNDCIQIINDSFAFKAICLETEDSLVPFLSNGIQLDLNEIVNNIDAKENSKGTYWEICRLCRQWINCTNGSFLLEMLKKNYLQKVFNTNFPEIVSMFTDSYLIMQYNNI